MNHRPGMGYGFSTFGSQPVSLDGIEDELLMPAKWILQWLQRQIDQGLLLGLKRRRPNPKNTMSTNL